MNFKKEPGQGTDIIFSDSDCADNLEPETASNCKCSKCQSFIGKGTNRISFRFECQDYCWNCLSRVRRDYLWGR